MNNRTFDMIGKHNNKLKECEGSADITVKIDDKGKATVEGRVGITWNSKLNIPLKTQMLTTSHNYW